MLSPDRQAFRVWPQPSTNWQVTNTSPGCFGFWQPCTNPSANCGWLAWFIITQLSSSGWGFFFLNWLIEDWSLNWYNTMGGLIVWYKQRRTYGGYTGEGGLTCNLIPERCVPKNVLFCLFFYEQFVGQNKEIKDIASIFLDEEEKHLLWGWLITCEVSFL